MSDTSAAEQLQQKHKKVWLQVSNTNGNEIQVQWAMRFLRNAGWSISESEDMSSNADKLAEQVLQCAESLSETSSQLQPKKHFRNMSTKVATRWGLLRQALRSSSTAADEHVSVRRHTGYALLATTAAPVAPAGTEKAPASYQVELHLWPSVTAAQHTAVSAGSCSFPLLAPVAPSITLSDLVAHRGTTAAAAAGASADSSPGVDNTGNVCVWPAEQVLTHLLLNAGMSGALPQGGCLLELGGGRSCMAAIAAACCEGFHGWHITGTDGNVKAAAAAAGSLSLIPVQGPSSPPGGAHSEALRQATASAQRRFPTCSAESMAFHLEAASLSTGSLQWDMAHARPEGGGVPVAITGSLPPTAHAAGETDMKHSADLVVAADCLFFESFAEHLLSTCYGALRQTLPAPAATKALCEEAPRDGTKCLATALLRPAAGSGAPIPQVWLVAPERGGSRTRFVQRAQSWVAPGGDTPAWSVLQFPVYDAAVHAAHEAAQAAGHGGYDVDLHHPLLVVLCAPHWEAELRLRGSQCQGVDVTL